MFTQSHHLPRRVGLSGGEQLVVTERGPVGVHYASSIGGVLTALQQRRATTR